MLRKLIKYDFSALYKITLIMMAVAILSGLFGGLCFRGINFIDEETSVFLVLVSALGFFFSLVLIVVSLIVVFVFIFIRFYKHLFTDEGYLTFTLPVKRSSILFSKTLVGFTCYSLALLAVCAGLFLLFYIGTLGLLDGISSVSLTGMLLNELTALWEQEGAIMIAYAVVILLILSAFLLLNLTLVYFCIAFATVIAKKARVIIAIGLYYGFNSIVGSLIELVLVIAAPTLSSNGIELLLAGSGDLTYNAVYLLMLFTIALFLVIVAAIFYIITLGIMERKLNLE